MFMLLFFYSVNANGDQGCQAIKKIKKNLNEHFINF